MSEPEIPSINLGEMTLATYTAIAAFLGLLVSTWQIMEHHYIEAAADLGLITLFTELVFTESDRSKLRYPVIGALLFALRDLAMRGEGVSMRIDLNLIGIALCAWEVARTMHNKNPKNDADP